MEFIMGMFMSIVIMVTIVGLIICIEENKKTNTLVKNIRMTNNAIIIKQEMIINEMGLDLNKQKQS